MVSGPGYAVGHISAIDSNDAVSSNATATFSSSGQLLSFTDAAAQLVSQGSTSIADAGNDGLIGWGRWTNGSYSINGAPQAPLIDAQSLHYVVGVPTANMPTTGSASYSLVGATTPTTASGSASGSFSLSSLTVNFAAATVNLAFNVNLSGENYAATTGAAPITGNNFSSSLGVTSPGICSFGCNGHVQGLFFGTAAERLGIAYRLNLTTISQTVNGTAAFRAP